MPMSRLCSRLFLGGIKDAERLAADNSAGITTVVSLCAEEVVTKRRGIKYVRIPVEDARPSRWTWKRRRIRYASA